MYVTISGPNEPTAFAQKLGANSATPVPTRLKAGAHLFHEGDPVKRVYQIISGVTRLTRMLEDGRRQVISFGFPGDIVGFPCGEEHHTDCEALTPVELISFRRTRLDGATADPDLHDSFFHAALNEIAAMQDHFMMLGRKSASEKVASFLLTLAGRIGTYQGHHVQIELPMRRADIADFLGLTTETVSRSFSQLRKDGVIALDGVQTVIVLSPDGLTDIADGEHSLPRPPRPVTVPTKAA